MSTQPKISDDEMRYFQFKARQLFMLKKENHEWNEFCKKSTCDCQLCRGSVKISKEIGIQASPRVATSTLGRNRSNTAGYQSRALPTALSEIQSRLQKIDSALSQMNITSEVTKEIVNQGVPELRLPCSSGTDELTWNLMNERRMQVIQNSLKASLQRLQSNVIQRARSAPSVNVKTKNSGFFLPPDLQVKRAAARRAYLAPLSKKNQIPARALSKNENINKKSTHKQNTQVPNAPPKCSKKTVLKSKKEGEDKVETLVASEGLTESKDENIENAVDGILDDLLGETVLVINKIKQIKSGVLNKNNTSAVLKKSSIPNSSVENETRIGSDPPKNWEKIRQNLFHLKTQCEKHSVTCDEHTGVNNEALIESKKGLKHEEMGDAPPTRDPQSENTFPKRLEVLDPKPHTSSFKARELTIHPNIAKEIEKSRKEYWKYLDRISRTKKGNFDPWMLSNMVAESLLDDCIAEVALELQDVPNNLFTDLYNQEFLQSI